MAIHSDASSLPSLPAEILNKWQGILNTLTAIAGVPAGRITRLAGTELEILVTNDGAGNPYRQAEMKPLRGLYCEAVLEGRSEFLVSDALREERWKNSADVALKMVSYLGLPVHWPDGELFGTICILDRKENSYSDVYRDLIAKFRDVVELDLNLLRKESTRGDAQQSSALLRAVVDGAADAIFVKDREGRFLLFNRAAEQFVGRDAEDVIGRTVGELFGPKAGETIREFELQVMRGGEPLTVEETMTANGMERTYLATRSPYRDAEGRIIGLIGISRDISDKKRVEEELYKSQLRWRFALDSSGDGIWDWDMKAESVYYSRQWKAMLGYEKDEIGDALHEWSDRVHPDDKELCWEAVNKHFQGNATDFAFEHRMRAKDGSWRWILSRGKVVERAGDGSPQRTIGTHTNITDRKHAEEELYRERERMAQAAETLQSSYEALRQAEKLARIGSWTLDLATNSFVSSDMLNEMNGLEPNDPPLTPDKLRELLPAEGFEKVRSGIERCIATGIPYDVETQHGSVDGSSYFAHIRGKANRDASGKVVSVTGTVQDITEREETRKRLAALADNLPNGAIYRLEHTDEDEFALTYISAGIFSITGIQAAEIAEDQNVFVKAIHEEDQSRYVAALRDSLATREVFDCQFRLETRAGETIWMHARSAPRYQVDGTTVWDGIMRDITEERRAAEILEQAKEAAEAAEQAKSDFLATMSHEIRTPMNTVLGMTRLALQTDLAPRQRNYLDKINTAANTLISIINDVLDFSKIEAGRLDLEETEFTLESMLESVAAVTAMRAEEKGLEIVYAVDGKVPDRLVGDSLRLGQVLINLVNNAVKFTHRGEVVVSVASVPQARANTVMLQFSVRDTGIGLDANQIAGLFRAFSQAERDISRKYGGTGLGLAICKRLVELMGGSIWVSSEPGKGSTFFFTIEADIPVDHVRRSLRLPTSGLSGRRVMIVDDNASAREILSEMVRHFDMNVEVVDSGASALTALKQASLQNRPFELVLMDWRMPGMDGLEAAQRIKADMQLRETPAVLMVTAYGREEILRRSEQLGLQGVLIKPVTESVMFNTIVDILDQTQRSSPMQIIKRHDKELFVDAAPAPSKEKWLAPLNHRRVLVVDDNALNREVVSDFLLLAGIEVATASNGLDALSRLDSGNFEAVLMDLHMPVMDGLTAAREIRRRDRWTELPIIALTAQARTEDRQASLAAGMNAHLTKPIDEMELYRTLLQLLPPAADRSEVEEHSGESEAMIESAGPVAASACVDLTAALARLGNNPDRLFRLLKGFVRDFTSAPAQVSADYSSGRTEDVAALAHTVKGSAAYLDAHELCEYARRLEESARRSDGVAMEQLIPAFRKHLETVLAHLNRVISQSVDHAAPPAVRIDLPAVLKLITQAEPLVANGDYAAQTLLDRIVNLLTGTASAGLAEEARAHFEELDLKPAVGMLVKLRDYLQQQTAGEISR